MSERDITAPGIRTIRLKSPTVNTETRTVDASLSSELAVRRWFGDEVLLHGEENIDLSRAAEGLPLLFGHNTRDFLGNVTNVRLHGRRLVGTLRFSKSQRATDVMRDVQDGLIQNLSIGYDITAAKDRGDDGIQATRWTPLEVSVAPVPADSTIGIGRNYSYQESRKMLEEITPEETPAVDPKKAIVDAEVERIGQIRLAFAKYQEPAYNAIMADCITTGKTVDEARAALLDQIGKQAPPVATAPVIQPVAPGKTIEQLMEESIAVRASVVTDKDVIAHCRDQNQYGGYTLMELSRAWLAHHGVSAKGGARQVASRAFSTRATQVTADFPEILANVAFKSLLKAFWDAPATWRPWTGIVPLQDFKSSKLVNLSEFPTLPIVLENGTYTEGTFTDVGEPIQLATYGKNYSISRESLINDDLSAFSRIPTAMGLAAARTIGDLAYAVLVDNAALSDTFALFNAANHDNDVQTGGAPPDADNVQAGKVAMALQKGLQGVATLGIMPRYAICPVALEGTFSTLMAAQYNPASTSGTLEPNVVQQLMTVVSDARLDAANPLQWYMAADPMMWDTVKMGFLDGQQQPFQERVQDTIANDSVTYKVRIDAAAMAADYRGLYRNSGEASPV